MTRTVITRTIHAPTETVFRVVAHIDEFAKAVPQIVRVERLADIHVGVGTRFREVRAMAGRESSTELEVTEYVENERVRLVADSHGTTWDTLFTVALVDEATELTMVMDAKAHTLLSKALNSLMKGMVRKAIERDMDAVKRYCEGDRPAHPPPRP